MGDHTRLSRSASSRSEPPRPAPGSTPADAHPPTADRAPDALARRNFLLAAGLAGTAAATGLAPPTAAAQAQGAPSAVKTTALAAAEPDAYQTLTETEAAFFSAAADTFIPADSLSPSGTECGVVIFIDRQLAGAWGGGAKLYRAGPFAKGKEGQGYQLPLTPREYFAAGIVATNEWSRKTYGKDFDRFSSAQRDEALKMLDSGKAQLDSFNGKQFLEALLDVSMEGFFSDPIYGGNRDKVSWKMIGFPGLPATYANVIEKYRGKRYVAEPQSIADFS